MKRIVCRLWLRNECQRGDACTYIHAMEEDKMPDCEYGDHCTIPGCPMKHPPKVADVVALAGADFRRESVCSTSRASVRTANTASTSRSGLCGFLCRHIRYFDGALPFTVDISSRSEQSLIDAKVRGGRSF